MNLPDKYIKLLIFKLRQIKKIDLKKNIKKNKAIIAKIKLSSFMNPKTL